LGFSVIFDVSLRSLGYYPLFEVFTIPWDHFYFSFFLNEDFFVHARSLNDLCYFSNSFLRWLQDISYSTYLCEVNYTNEFRQKNKLSTEL
jgi:hypothetical protein